MHSIPLTSEEVWKWNPPLEVYCLEGVMEENTRNDECNVVGRADQRQLRGGRREC